MSNGPIEPNADMRQFAAAVRQMYLALMQEGFTESEAMHLCSITVAKMIEGNNRK